MITLYHYLLCPFSRAVRMLLSEKRVEFNLKTEAFWERNESFLKLNVFGTTPSLVCSSAGVINGKYAILEYIEEQYNSNLLHCFSSIQRSSIRGLIEWLHERFYNEVTQYLLREKLIKVVSNTGSPKSQPIRIAKANLDYHLKYMEHLMGDNACILHDKFSVADIVLASHISVIDYFGDVPWEKFSKLKSWYRIMKSRPSLRIILKDKVKLVTPPLYYTNPDF